MQTSYIEFHVLFLRQFWFFYLNSIIFSKRRIYLFKWTYGELKFTLAVIMIFE